MYIFYMKDILLKLFTPQNSIVSSFHVASLCKNILKAVLKVKPIL